MHPKPHKPAYIYDVDEHSFKAEVIERSHESPVLVDFWADWCPPCLALTPTLEKVAHEQQGRFQLAKVEVDDNMRLAGHYKLRGFPTVIVFWQGEPVERFSGNKPLHFVRDLVSRVLEPA